MIELLLEAESALSLGMLDRAEILYRQVAGADPRNSIAVVGLARVMLERGDEPGALKVARRAFAIDPENTAAQRMVQRLEEVLRYRGSDVSATRAVPAPTRPVPAPPAEPTPTTLSAATAPAPTAPPASPAPTTVSAAPHAADTEPIAPPESPPPVPAPPSRSFVDRLLRRR